MTIFADFMGAIGSGTGILLAVNIIYDIIGDDEKKNLPIFNKIHNFFANKKEDFVIDFDELVDYKGIN